MVTVSHVLDEDKAFELLTNRAAKTPVFIKKAVVAIGINNTAFPLYYDTVLRGGKVENSGGVVPPGFAFVVQPGGEVHVLVKGGKPSHQKLYKMDNPLNFAQAQELARERGLILTQPEQFYAAELNFGDAEGAPDISAIPFGFYESQGRIRPYLMPNVILLPKAAWETTQRAEKDSALVENLPTEEAYYISLEEIGELWTIEATPGLTRKAMREQMLRITQEEFEQMLMSPEDQEAKAELVAKGVIA